MQFAFTNHALERMRFRRIEQNDVLDALRFPDIIQKKEYKYLYRKRVSAGIIEIVCEKTENHLKIITVYWV